MADYGVAVIWGEAKPGREKKALELFAEASALNDKAVSDGRLEGWDAVIFEPSGTPPNGVFRVHGSLEQIEAHIRAEQFQGQIQQAVLVLNGFGVKRFVTGAALAERMANYTKLVDSL